MATQMIIETVVPDHEMHSEVKLVLSVTKNKAGNIKTINKHWKVYIRPVEPDSVWQGGWNPSNWDFWNVKKLLEQSSDPLHQEILSKFRI